MAGGLNQTLQVLATTNNEAATQLLLNAVDGPNREIQAGALRALVRRRSPAGHGELLQRWSDLSERHKSTIAEQNSRMSGSLREAILSGDTQLAEKALDAVLRLREYDLVATLITVGEDRSSPRADRASRIVLELAEMLYDEISASAKQPRQRRDPQLTRKYVVAALEESAKRFDQHRRVELLEAFLLLTTPNNGFLRQLLQNPYGKIYLPAINLFSQSTRPGVQALLLGLFASQQPPGTVHGLIARRKDVPFLRQLFACFSGELSKTLKANARRIESFSWLEDDLTILKALGEDEQRGAVALVMASAVNRLHAFELVRFMLEQGGESARRLAAEALADFRGADANQLCVNCLEDRDVEIRAQAVSQLRDRGIPGAMQRVISLVDATEAPVAEAAKTALDEFSFDRLLAAFELLDEAVARSTGRLVRQVDRQAIEKLTAEFESPSRTRRLRAIKMSVAMDAVADVETRLVEMLNDEDHFIRADAATALGNSPTAAARAALRDRLNDPSPSVQEAAEAALQRLAHASGRPTPGLPNLAETTENLMQFSRESLR